MAKKSKKRVTRRPAKKSWVEKLFTFPKLAVFGFIILSAFTVYYVSRPSANIMGASTVDYVMYTQAEVDALPKMRPTEYNFPHYVRTKIWRDSNENGKEDNFESCPNKKYSFYVNGVKKTRQTEDCEYAYVKIPKCSGDSTKTTIKFIGTVTSNPYKFTALNYSDAAHKSKVKFSKTVTICGDTGYGEGYGYNDVNFGVKAN